jgi:mannose-6-phosphate isomerase
MARNWSASYPAQATNRHGPVTALLPTRMVEKPWGCDRLPAPFVTPPGRKIGEIWFEPPAQMPGLLAKYIFTSERLSIQNHPGGPAGKEECWLVIAAEPGARLGIGFREPISAETLRAAALDGNIVDLLVWHPVKVGDFFHILPGTVHAIGAGVCLMTMAGRANCTLMRALPSLWVNPMTRHCGGMFRPAATSAW